jgi:hypothetical protein
MGAAEKMKKDSYNYSFKTSKTTHEVFELLLDVEQWWSGLYQEAIEGKSQHVNDEFTFKAGGGLHNSKQKLIELVPDKRVVWLVTNSNLSFLSNTAEWDGTEICFDLSKEENNTKVSFTHEGLMPQIECYENCSAAWTGYLDNLKKRLQQ